MRSCGKEQRICRRGAVFPKSDNAQFVSFGRASVGALFTLHTFPAESLISHNFGGHSWVPRNLFFCSQEDTRKQRINCRLTAETARHFRRVALSVGKVFARIRNTAITRVFFIDLVVWLLVP
jgi:hypothetical protein